MNAPATILIVDDDVHNRRLLCMLLKTQGYHTVEAATGEVALEMVIEHSPDLILLDLMLPGISGHEVARLLKADPASANIPIIMVTVKIDREARLVALKAGVEEFLTKPIDRAELWLRVRNLLRLKQQGDQLADHSANLENEIQARTTDLQRFRSAMDATADAIFLINRTSMRIVEANTTTSDMLGYSREELLRMQPSDFGAASLEEYARNYDAMIDNPVPGREIAATEVRLLRRDGTRIEVEVRRHALRSGDDWVIVAVLRDITARREAEERLHRLAHYDALTGLPNRTLFYSTLSATLAAAAKQGSAVAVLFMDLDRFKNVNDTLGHAAGDNLLRQYATRLVECAGRRDTIGRLGGDEFALILTMENAPAGAVHEISQIREAMRAPFDLDGQLVIATTSVGIAICPDDALDAQILIKFADTAMYSAKQAGRDTFRFFTAQMNDEFMAKLDMERAVRRAVENNELSIHYQTKVDLRTDLIVGLEALLRWNRPGFGPVSPVDFVPVLEETGLIVQVGKQVIETACEQIADWQSADIGKIPISVNVSASQLVDDEFEEHILRSLDRYSVAAELLELELTESTLMVNTDQTISALRSLKERGVRISIDDFGTGYSSLAYLRRFPIDMVKIDKAFISDITNNPDDAAIVSAIIQMSHSLRLRVIAEGVETAEQLAYLHEHGCDEAQGFYFSKPEPASAVATRLRKERHTHLFHKQNNHWHASTFDLIARVFRPERDQPAVEDVQARQIASPISPPITSRSADEAA